MMHEPLSPSTIVVIVALYFLLSVTMAGPGKGSCRLHPGIPGQVLYWTALDTMVLYQQCIGTLALPVSRQPLGTDYPSNTRLRHE